MTHAVAVEGGTGRRIRSITDQRDAATRAAGNRWRELYIKAAGLPGRKRQGEGLPGRSEARSADRGLGDGQAARTRVAKGDGLRAGGSDLHIPESHAARTDA